MYQKENGSFSVKLVGHANNNFISEQLTPENQTQLKNELLTAVQSESQGMMRRKVCEVVSELARQLLDDDGNNQWPEFLRFLFESASNGTPELKESALQMFGSVPGIFGNQQSQYLNVIKQMLQQCMTDWANYSVRFQAVKALSSFILLHDDDLPIQKQFQVFAFLLMFVCYM